ncbi:MAG: YceI family protein [Flavobacterium sp.]|nr:YceI family protein [Flavobacterium sp.]
MRTIKTLLLATLATITLSATAQTKKIDVTKSTINWVGKKVTGQHSGTLSIKSGALVFKKSKLAGGTFVVDMTTINTTDLKAGEGKEDLDGHLKSPDFFGTEKFPTATLVFKTLAAKTKGVYAITADLTIKGISNPISFDLATAANSATTTLKVNRTKYDIKYNSGNFFQNLGDKVISDDFELNVALKY